MNKNTRAEAEERIEKALADPNNVELRKLAACMLAIDWDKGYGELTNNSEFYKHIEGLWCSWCGTLHRSTCHDKLSTISPETWDVWRDEEMKLNPDSWMLSHPVNRALKHGIITQEEADE